MIAHDSTIQDDFLDRAIAHSQYVDVYLLSGIRLYGKILMHDRFAFSLEKDSNRQLVYKHAVASVRPWLDQNSPGPDTDDDEHAY